MAITLAFTEPFYFGVGNSNDTPDRYDIAINGRGYMLDRTHPTFKQGLRTIPLIRPQADVSDEPGESSSNPEDLWPRSQSSWHLGAGQQFLDATDSVRTRFRRSLGIDPWERGQVSLLPDTELAAASVATNVRVIRAGNYVYLSDGNQLLWSQAPFTSWTSADIHAGDAPQSVRSTCSSGSIVYAALGSNGVHQTTVGAASSSELTPLAATLVAYVKSRLMAANGNAIYNITASGPAPSALLAHPNPNFTWVGFAEGTGHIYAAGYAGDKSLIYKTAVKQDGTTLDVPTIAGQLPDGEIIRSIQGGLGFIIVGTDYGWRLGAQDGQGNLTFGALVKTTSPCRAFEFQDRFIWFGWENYDNQRTGLGRMDLAQQTAELVPAYASDLMAGNAALARQGSVLSVITAPNGKRMFTVSGVGLFVQSDAFVPTGFIDSGQISFGITNNKVALRAELKHKPLPIDGSVDIYVSANEDAYVLSGSSAAFGTVTPLNAVRVPEMTGQLFEVRLVLNNGAIAQRYDFRSYPAARRGFLMQVPILLTEYVTTATDAEEFVDVPAERARLEGYVGSGRLLSYQEGDESFSMFVSDTSFERSHYTQDRRAFQGTLVATLKILGD